MPDTNPSTAPDPRPVVEHYRAALHSLTVPTSADQHVAASTATTALATLAAAGIAALRWQAENHGDPASIRALIDIGDLALGRNGSPAVVTA
jgi:ribose 1,5-bisphosphokinase PhnN